MMSPVQEDEGPNAVSQLARKVGERWRLILKFWDILYYKKKYWTGTAEDRVYHVNY